MSTSMAGYNCIYCGSWVSPLAPHWCSAMNPNQPEQHVHTYISTDQTPELRRIAEALERIADALEARP